MSWMQYLAVSRSFSSIENRPTRFRMRDEYLLPRFGGTQDNEESEEAATGTCEPRRAEQPIRPEAKGSAMQNTIAETENTAPATPQAAYPGGRWRIWRNPFGHTVPAKPAAAPVQTEMRLDAVKVVRNDLTDTDLLLIARPAATDTGERAAKRVRRTNKNERSGLLGRVQQLFAGF